MDNNYLSIDETGISCQTSAFLCRNTKLFSDDEIKGINPFVSKDKIYKGSMGICYGSPCEVKEDIN